MATVKSLVFPVLALRSRLTQAPAQEFG